MERIEQVPNIRKKHINLVGVRANLPKILGVLAIVGLIASIIWITFGFLSPKDKPFIMKGKEVQLSQDVTAVVTGYERRETEGQVTKYYIKADKATTFTDNHQELENVYLETYDKTGEKFDKITAAKSIYVPHSDNSKLFTAQFIGNVNIETRDALKVKSELITYDHESEIAESTELVEFEQLNVKGKSVGTKVHVKERQIELLKEVEINANADPKLEEDKVAEAKLQSAKIVSGYAMVQETTVEGQPIEQKINAKQNVVINLLPLGNQSNLKQPTDVKADEATAYLIEKKVKKIDLVGNTEVFSKPTASNPEYTKINSDQNTALFEQELQNATATGNVYIEANRNGTPSKIRSQYAVYDKPTDKFDLKNSIEIITVDDGKQTVVRSNEAIYEQTNGRIFLTGGANITQGSSLVKGDAITAQLYPNKKIQNSVVRGNGFLRQVAPERTTEVTANELNAAFGVNENVQNAFGRGNAFLKQITPERTTEIRGNELNATFNANQQLQASNVTGASSVVVTPTQPQEYSKATLLVASGIKVFFTEVGIVNQMLTEGRTTVKMDSPNNDPNSANKRLTADNVKTFFNAGGKDLSKVEAVGNAELVVEPLNAAPSNYKTTINAPRFDCDFYGAGNIAKNCSAMTKAKVIRVPTVNRANRGVQTLTADRLDSTFNQKTQDIKQFDATGNAKFNENDRNGIAERMSYTADNEVVYLRGGEPTVFDSRARAKAGEIDWDTKNQKSFLRGNVSTTYYNQKQTNGATPFTRTNTPVYLTANEAQFDHLGEIGTYTGNARAWQENNYVKANQLVLYQKESRLAGEGKIQSLLYTAQRKEGGKVVNQPVSATSDKIAYNDKDKHLQYQNNVDIRQGTERITGGLADVYLSEKNEVKQTIVQNDVVITQPKRKVRGTWAQYTTADETVILRGNPATAEDSEQGTTQGSQITVSMKDNTIVNQGTTKQGGSGRTRTVYKIKNQ